MKNLISVVIATYNRCESLRDTLNDFVYMKRSDEFDFEIIVADNNSTDNTKEIVNNYKASFGEKIQYYFEPVQGKYTALNSGIKQAHGKIIALTDDDCIVSKDWLFHMWKTFQEIDCDVLGGRVLIKVDSIFPAWLRGNIDLLNGPLGFYDYGNKIKRYNPEIMLPFVGANTAFKRQCFEECGLFRTEFGPGKGKKGGDTEFSRRLQKVGKKMYYAGSVVVTHRVQPEMLTLRYISKWYIQSGRYAAAKKQMLNKNFVCYFGVPRYLFREVIQDSISMLPRIFNQRACIESWLKIFFTIGQILGFREAYCAKG